MRVLTSEWLIFGPLALLCTLALAHLPMDLLVVGVVGVYLSAKWHLRGLTYAIIALALVGVFHHMLVAEGHLWQLGLEVSVGVAFFVTALAFEHHASEKSALCAQLEVRDGVIRNLEEDLGKEKEEGAAEKIAVQEKVELLQKELEEAQGEQSSILMLNDVLRKTTARHLEEKRNAEEKARQVKEQLDVVQQELQRLTHESALVQQNRELFEELNAARVAKEQTHQINTSVVRLHAKEAARAKVMEQQLQALSEERNFLKDRLAQAVVQIKPEERDVALLYQQLKKQFREKDQVLHETRAKLFQAETALEALKIEKEQQGQEFPLQMQKEIERLELELSVLRQEKEIIPLTDTE